MAKRSKKVEKTVEKEVSLNEISANKNVIFVIVIIALGVLILWGLMDYTKNVNKFSYNNIDFEKNAQGSIIFYTAKIPIKTKNTEDISYLEIDFRNDPRTLKDIPVNIQTYTLSKNNKTYISYQQTNKTYEDGTLAGANLGRFLSLMGLNIKSAMSDPSFKNNTVLPYVTCQTNPDNMVLMLYEGKANEISQFSSNCYVLMYTETDILRVTEKFELSILETIMQN